jgi:hypothetical protein
MAPATPAGRYSICARLCTSMPLDTRCGRSTASPRLMVQRSFSQMGMTSPSMAFSRVLPESRTTASQMASAFSTTAARMLRSTRRRSSKLPRA